MEYAICLARSRLNNMAPVYKLPSELLGQCFAALMVQSVPDVYVQGSAFLGLDIGWLSVTHVCHKWRDVALAQASLWVTVPFCLGPSWIATFIERALTCPLDIPFGSETPLYMWKNHQDMLDTVLDIIECHLFHIGRIIVDGIEYVGGELGAPFIQEMMVLLTNRAPMLRTIKIMSDDFHISLPANLLGHGAPRLASFTVARCDTTWTRILLRNLTSLDITSSIRLSTHDPLMEVLRANPTLEVLKLRSTLPSHPSTSAASSVITLHHLVKLDLSYDSITAYHQLIKALDIPPTCILSLTEATVETQDSLRDCLSLIAILSAHINRHVEHIDGLSLQDLTNTLYVEPICFTVWRGFKYDYSGLPVLSARNGEGGAVLVFEARVTSRHTDAVSREAWKQQIALALLQHLSLSSVVALMISRSREPVTFLLPVLHSMQNIQYLAFDGNTFDFMQRLLTAATTDPPHAIPLPRLRSLAFRRTEDSVMWTFDSQLSESESSSLAAAILDTLRKRRDLGVPLQKLFLIGFSFNPAHGTALEEIMPAVEYLQA